MKLRCSLLFILSLPWHVLGGTNFTALCEHERERRIASNSSLADDPTFVCGQNYAEGKPPAARIAIPLDQCRAESPGWEISMLGKPSQWAGPLVGFLLPALAFIIVIPREWVWKIETPHLDGGFLASAFWLPATLVVLTIDTLLIGIPVVFGWAGPFIAGAIHEALTDQATLSRVKDQANNIQGQVTPAEWYALVITLVGSFAPNTRQSSTGRRRQYQRLQAYPHRQQAQPDVFKDLIHDELANQVTAVWFVTRICAQFWSFSQVVGVPLIFYIGAFTYSPVDADARLGENDTAHSVAFGLWYLVIVFVALTSSAVLGVSAPNVIESVLAHRGITSEDYKHKWLSERRATLVRWANLQDCHDVPILRREYSIIFDRKRYPFAACVLTLLIIGVPCGLAITVSYYTPEIGPSCRSVTVMSYLACQTLLVFLWFFHSSHKLRELRKDPTIKLRLWLTLWIVSIVYVVVGFLALGIAMAGTIMQLLGVYRNCVCKAGLWYGLPTTKDTSRALVLISTDTADMRESAWLWKRCGIVGIAWVGVCSIVCAIHRLRMRQRCLNLVEDFGNRLPRS